MGFEKYRETDRYLIAPDEYADRSNMSKVVGRLFSFFWKKTNIQKEISFKNLRKTYYTRYEIFIIEGGAKDVSNHDSARILKMHYIDKMEVAKAIAKTSFFVFPENKKQ